MNFITHFLTGYGIARGLKYQNDRFEAFYLSATAIIPDFDLFVSLFWPEFAHGVFSHTILGGLLFAFGFFGFAVLLLHSFLRRLDIKWTRLLALTMIGLATHFLLDIFTHTKTTLPSDAHLYFWPFWDFSFHMNYIWGVDYWVRILVEVVYTGILVILIVFYDWFAKKHNLFYMFVPKFWWQHTKDHLPAEQMPKTPYIYLGIFIAAMALMIANYGF